MGALQFTLADCTLDAHLELPSEVLILDFEALKSFVGQTAQVLDHSFPSILARLSHYLHDILVMLRCIIIAHIRHTPVASHTEAALACMRALTYRTGPGLGCSLAGRLNSSLGHVFFHSESLQFI